MLTNSTKQLIPLSSQGTPIMLGQTSWSLRTNQNLPTVWRMMMMMRVWTMRLVKLSSAQLRKLPMMRRLRIWVTMRMMMQSIKGRMQSKSINLIILAQVLCLIIFLSLIARLMPRIILLTRLLLLLPGRERSRQIFKVRKIGTPEDFPASILMVKTALTQTGRSRSQSSNISSSES